ncbi:hypothetical protein [Parafrankia sp. EUN1f]|uniref:hypothetical protein n=1 Tax=Parafrankia sp. EUN1f TaxID=102897 RepID=UPI0001C463E9|nr:hypothetical protein [Parafrankia sp. EUN1f]EFC81184.1 hypothetical protein FrEUN1fDRAFT_5713 [Parafrankia sp. EUN1f]
MARSQRVTSRRLRAATGWAPQLRAGTQIWSQIWDQAGDRARGEARDRIAG